VKRAVLAGGLLSLLLPASAPLAAQARSPWCRYQVRAPDSIIAQHVESVKGSDLVVTGHQFPSRMSFRFTGTTRPLSDARRDFLEKYFKAVNRPGGDTLFRHELHVTRDSARHYWFPIQEATLGDFRAEVAPGDSTTLFLLWAGAFGPKAGPKEWVFLINEFSSKQSAGHWAEELATCP
jgi:hypothetical protein